MNLKLFGDIRSPCVRAVLITANLLDIKFEYIPIDILKNEHLTPDYLKINPRHTVPALDDNGFKVWDSHAIMIYLAEKYGRDNSIYPENPQNRAVINQMLFFEIGDIFTIDKLISGPIIVKGQKEVPADLVQILQKGYEFTDSFLTNSKYVAGNLMTIADISIWTTLSNAEIFVPVDEKKYPRLAKWLTEMNRLPCSQLNEVGKVEFFKLVKKLLHPK